MDMKIHGQHMCIEAIHHQEQEKFYLLESLHLPYSHFCRHERRISRHWWKNTNDCWSWENTSLPNMVCNDFVRISHKALITVQIICVL